jgi:hypothetical protein
MSSNSLASCGNHLKYEAGVVIVTIIVIRDLQVIARAIGVGVGVVHSVFIICHRCTRQSIASLSLSVLMLVLFAPK